MKALDSNCKKHVFEGQYVPNCKAKLSVFQAKKYNSDLYNTEIEQNENINKIVIKYKEFVISCIIAIVHYSYLAEQVELSYAITVMFFHNIKNIALFFQSTKIVTESTGFTYTIEYISKSISNDYLGR